MQPRPSAETSSLPPSVRFFMYGGVGNARPRCKPGPDHFWTISGSIEGGQDTYPMTMDRPRPSWSLPSFIFPLLVLLVAPVSLTAPGCGAGDSSGGTGGASATGGDTG